MHYNFPDTAEFGGNILDVAMPINNAMETYSKLALLLFYPCRQLSDVHVKSSYTLKLCDAVLTGKIREKATNFL
jgi:hypothetical protein